MIAMVDIFWPSKFWLYSNFSALRTGYILTLPSPLNLAISLLDSEQESEKKNIRGKGVGSFFHSNSSNYPRLPPVLLLLTPFFYQKNRKQQRPGCFTPARWFHRWASSGGLDYFNDGSQFATAGKDRLLRVYDEATKRQVMTLQGGDMKVRDENGVVKTGEVGTCMNMGEQFL